MADADNSQQQALALPEQLKQLKESLAKLQHDKYEAPNVDVKKSIQREITKIEKHIHAVKLQLKGEVPLPQIKKKNRQNPRDVEVRVRTCVRACARVCWCLLAL